MSNINKSQISGRIITPFVFKSEQNISLTEETLSIVGTSAMGPAFVPQQVVSFGKTEEYLNSWENIFGSFEYQEEQVGPIAANIWLNNNGSQLTYTRVLGIGDGLGLDADSNYSHAGFIVGDEPLQDSINEYVKGPSKYSVAGGDKGKTHFFGKYVKNIDLDGFVSPYEDYIEQITNTNTSKIGIITDVVFASNGTKLLLQTEHLDSLKLEDLYSQLSSSKNVDAIDFGGDTSKLEDPKVYIQGLTEKRHSVISLPNNSNLYNKTNFFESTFNTVPEFYNKSGNFCYASFRDTVPFKSLTVDDSDPNNVNIETKHFVTTGANDWNASVGEEVNYENFESVYTKAKTPWVVSQPVYEKSTNGDFHNNCKKLFRFHTYTDGKKGNKYRFRIKPRRLGNDESLDFNDRWSIFDIVVYKFDYKNNDFHELMTFIDLNLDPKSENYIGKKIGTEHEYYDLSLKQIIHKGSYKKTNNHIFVEIHEDVEYLQNEPRLIPCGFLPYPMININRSKTTLTEQTEIYHNPIRYVGNREILDADGEKITFSNETHWGVQFNKTSLVEIKNIKFVGGEFNFKFDIKKESSPDEYRCYHNYTKYFQDFKQNKFWITPFEDTNNDVNNGFFHLEKILYTPNESTTKERWKYAFYRRDGKLVENISSNPSVFEYIKIDEVLRSDSEADADAAVYLSFDFFTYGGFDGINILDENKRKMNNESCLREFSGEIAGQTKGQTTYAYKTAKDIALDLNSYRCDLLYIAGISTPEIVKDVVDIAENSRQFQYLLDSVEYDDSEVPEIIRDEYYFNNTDNKITDMLDERDTVKSKTINGTYNSINNHFLNYYNSKFSISTMNKCEAVLNDKNIVIPSSIVFLNSMSQTSSINQPIDSVDYSNTILTITDLVNSKFVYYNNNFDELINKTKLKDYRLNPVGVMTAGKKINVLSSNNLLNSRNNAMSLFHNVRIYLDIKRNLKNLLISEPILGNDTVLFSLNSEVNPFSNAKANLLATLNTFFQDYVQRGVIKNYFVDVNISNFDKTKLEKLEHTISGNVGFSLFGENQSEDLFLRLSLNNLINDITSFTEENNIDILNVNR